MDRFIKFRYMDVFLVGGKLETKYIDNNQSIEMRIETDATLSFAKIHNKKWIIVVCEFKEF